MTLQEWFDQEDSPSKSAFARLLGKSPGYIGDLCSGRCDPSLAMALAIEHITEGKVPPSSWLTAA